MSYGGLPVTLCWQELEFSFRAVGYLFSLGNMLTSSVKNLYCISHSDFHIFVNHQVFRKDLISAMKIPDSQHVNTDDYYHFADTWKQEWEKGVQVPANPDAIPQPSLRYQ